MLSNEAAMVLGLAGTAVPFAGGPEEEAERWLRVLRLHGDVSSSLQAAGIGEVPIVATDGVAREAAAREAAGEGEGDGDAGTRQRDAQEVIKQVTKLATRSAQDRGARTVSTVDVLIGAMEFYGDDFDRILEAYGTDREEILQRARAAVGPGTTSHEHEPFFGLDPRSG
ncbi:MAG: hypothetical protein KGJ43_07015 [Acidobacteriota bacterium]|nr:hypothetical protein [Acidobacteriota bacterium]